MEKRRITRPIGLDSVTGIGFLGCARGSIFTYTLLFLRFHMHGQSTSGAGAVDSCNAIIVLCGHMIVQTRLEGGGSSEGILLMSLGRPSVTTHYTTHRCAPIKCKFINHSQ